MKLINSSYEILEQASGIQGIYEHIERVGKTCYKSEVKGGDTAKNFVNKMIENQHYAMLEHGTIYLLINCVRKECLYYHCKEYETNPYSRVYIQVDDDDFDFYTFYITTNLRVLVENGWLEDLQFLCEPTKYHTKRVTVRFICDRAISLELVRHRAFSFAQESTRFCNYSTDRFGNTLTFIKPVWYDSVDHKIQQDFEATLDWTESTYIGLLKAGLTPQQARQVLPNALKTEICMTGYVDENGWKHFFDLRALDKTGPAHPDMKALALPLYEDFKSKGWI